VEGAPHGLTPRGGSAISSVAVPKQKKIVKELKQPDQFVDFWTRSLNRLAEVIGPRQKPVIAGVVALIVVMTGVIIFQNVDDDHKVQASDVLVRIQKIATADLEPAPGADGAKTTPPTVEKDKDDVPRFKTAAERQQAVLKEIDAFLAMGSSSALRAEALVLKGGQLLEGGRFDDAIAAYDSALGAKLDVRMRFLAHEGKGYAFEGKGDLDKAAAAFGELEQDAGAFHGFYRDRATYQKARIAERKGDRAGAVKLYKQVLEKSGESPLHDEITDRLAVLEAK
jgi:tetratricopeptide (TPR) repeat protein